MGTRERVLELLERNRGLYVSGEQLAGQLDVSRNAVWRAIKDLRAGGYGIDAVTNKGYRLLEENDQLSVPGIKPHLESIEWADRLELYDELPSTNTLAKQRAVAEAPHGTVIVAERQTAGRGRHRRGFFSPPGTGLYLSAVLEPKRLGFATPTAVTAFAALCTCRAIESLSPLKPAIKWVNDVLLDGKKVCGILTEAISDFESGSISRIVVGIGINVTTPPQAFPDDCGSAGSLYPEGNAPFSRNELAAALVNRLCGAAPGEGGLFRDYKARLMMLGAAVEVSQGAERFRATAVNLDEQGRLLVRREDGKLSALSHGEVQVKLA